MNSSLVSPGGRAFLERGPWRDAAAEPLAGDASLRKYLRLRQGGRSAVLMDASLLRDSVEPFFQIATHLKRLGLSAPEVLAWDAQSGFMLLEDFGDATFTRLLESQADPEPCYTVATDALIALHKHPEAIPAGLRAYDPDRMLQDIEMFLEWRTPGVGETAQEAYRRCWREALRLAHRAPESLLLRDYHVANLMWLPDRQGIQRAGLLDFQDAYRGPVTYDLVSLLQDARRDVPAALQAKMILRYREHFPGLDTGAFETSMAVVAALRHTRVLAIFERLSAREGKHDYKRLHSPRVERMLQNALSHPALADVKKWFEHYAG